MALLQIKRIRGKKPQKTIFTRRITMSPKKTRRTSGSSSKKELLFSIFTRLFNQRAGFYGMYAQDQIWLIEHAREALYLIANAIELRVPLRKALRTFEVVIPKYIRNNHTHAPSMIERMGYYQGILLELREDDLLWMSRNTKQLIAFIIKVITNRKKVADWIASYCYASNCEISVGDFYVSLIGDHQLNLIGEDIFITPKSAQVFYVLRKNESEADNWWECISIRYEETGRNPPKLYTMMNHYDFGVKLTPRVEQKLLAKGVVIDKDFLRSFVDKVDTLEAIIREGF